MKPRNAIIILISIVIIASVPMFFLYKTIKEDRQGKKAQESITNLEKQKNIRTEEEVINEAIAAFEEAEKTNPTRLPIDNPVERQRIIDEAIAAFEEAEKANPTRLPENNPEERQRIIDEAIAAFEEAEKANPTKNY